MPSSTRNASDLLIDYARRHRDPRNIALHMLGIPMVVLAAAVLLGHPAWGATLTPAWLVWLASTLWYLTRGQISLGLAVSLANFGLFALAAVLTQNSLQGALAWGSGLWGLGWLIQLAGHYYEGRKRGVADDLLGLLVGPMFVTAEALFALGWGAALRDEISRRAGPQRLRDLTVPAT